MRSRTTLLIIILLNSFNGLAQLADDFSDGDFSADPKWLGDMEFWKINDSGQLQSNSAGAATYFLSTSSKLARLGSWEFYVNLKFSTSGTNYVDVYLVSDEMDLNASQNGYFVRIGDTNDYIVLYRISAGVVTRIVNSPEGVVNSSSNNPFMIRVSRGLDGEWTLMYDDGNLGSYVTAGTAVDNTILTGAYFGIKVVQSSAAGPVRNHFFDDFRLDQLRVDTLEVLSSTELLVSFNQPLPEAEAEILSHYGIDGIDLVEASQAADHQVLLRLDENTPFTSGSYTLEVLATLTQNDPAIYDFSYTQLELESVLTLSGTSVQLTFNDAVDEISAETIGNYSIDRGIGVPVSAVRDEADPSKVTLELATDLVEGVTFELSVESVNNTTGNSVFSGVQPFDFTVPLVVQSLDVLDEHALILVFNKPIGETAAETVANYVLDNASAPASAELQPDDQSVLLMFDAGFTDGLHALVVSGVESHDGSTTMGSGTYGFHYLHLALSEVIQLSENRIQLVFNQALNAATAEMTTHYILTEMGPPNEAQLSDTNRVSLSWDHLYNSSYVLSISGVANARQNSGPSISESVQIVNPTAYRQVILHEIMADPTPVVELPDAEYIELYNPSDYSIHLSGFRLNGEPLGNYLLLPGSYVLITDDSDSVAFGLENSIALPSFDVLTNTGEQVVLTDQFNNVVDSLTYNLNWYGASEKSNGGYALELIDPLQPCSDQQNWSASVSASGGTPGYVNSVHQGGDDTPPRVESVSSDGSSTIRVVFSEPFEESAIHSNSFSIPGYHIASFVIINWRTLLLELGTQLESEQFYTLEITNIPDCRGNVLASATYSFYHDLSPPQLDHLFLMAPQMLALVFSEALDETRAETSSNYAIPGLTFDRIQLQDSAINRVHVMLEEHLVLDSTYSLSFRNIADTSGNVIAPATESFTFHTDVDTAYAVAPNLLILEFSKVPESGPALNPRNYQLAENESFPAEISLDESDPSRMHLAFTENFEENEQLWLFMTSLKDQESHAFLSTPAVSFIRDTRSPSVEELRVKNDHQLAITWNEALMESSATISAHYLLEDGEQPVQVNKINSMAYELTFSDPFETEVEKTLAIKGIQDLYGNEMTTTRRSTFVYDPLPPQIIEMIYLGQDSVRITFSEQVSSTSATDLAHYSVNGVGPVQAGILGPDSARVVLTFARIAASYELDLMVTEVADLRENLLQEVHLLLDSRTPSVTGLQAINDSTLLVTYNQVMEDAAFEQVNYALEEQTIVAMGRWNERTAWISLETALADGDSLMLHMTNLRSEEGLSLATENFNSVFETYFSAGTLLNDQTIELVFETELDTVSKSQFSISDDQVALAISDGADHQIIRVSLSGPLTADEPVNLFWSGMADRYGRKLPDFHATVELDTQLPEVIAVQSAFYQHLLVTFSEPMDPDGGVSSLNKYQISGVGYATGIAMSSDSSVTLNFEGRLLTGSPYELLILPVADLSGNFSEADTVRFEYAPPVLPVASEILITELMVDPSPMIGLPEVEYVELMNAGNEAFDLSAMHLRDATAEVELPSFDLLPGAYVLLVGSGRADLFADLPVVEVPNFPTLGNSSDEVTLVTIMGDVVDRVAYSSSWYGDTSKDDGGYSLELINPFSSCPGSANWTASLAAAGGTPGAQNSVYSVEPDSIAPEVVAVSLTDAETLEMTFNEAMDSLSLITLTFTGLEVEGISVSGEGLAVAEVKLSSSLVPGQLYYSTVEGGRDCSGNTMKPYTFPIGLGDVPGFNDLIITEIMADPEPVAGLPNSEYLELFNASGRLLSLAGLVVSDATNTVALPSVTIAPESYWLLIPASSLTLYPGILNKTGLSNWPSLNNTGETLILSNAEGVIFEISYSEDWYGDDEKGEGGYSLEMKDVSNPCGGSVNWGTALAETGGTPAAENSNRESVPDHFGPNLTQAIALAADTVLLIFDEQLNAEALDNTGVIFEPSLSVESLRFGSSYSHLLITLAEKLRVNEVHDITVMDVTDCNENTLRKNTSTVVMTDAPDSLDVVISEILFNPEGEGVDFVELYNRSEKYLDLYGWQVVRRTDETDAEPISQHYVLAPGTYVALTEDTLLLKTQYPLGLRKALLQTDHFPAFPNEEGTVNITDSHGYTIDQFTYSENYHLSFLESVDGVSLERIDPDFATQDPDNWTSAASAVGYATPGYVNSQSFEITTPSTRLEVAPKIFVPGSVNPAYATFTTISYQLSKAGQFANVTIYNQLGQPVNQLEKGASLSTSGFFRWDGTSGSGELVRRGYYVVVFEVYDGAGNHSSVRETVVVGH